MSPRTFAAKRETRREAGPLERRFELELPAGTAHVLTGFAGPDLGEIEQVRALNLAAQVAKQRLNRLCGDGRLAASMCVAQLMPARTHPGLGAMLLMTRVPDEDARVNDALAALQGILDDLVNAGPRAEELAEASDYLADQAERRVAQPDYWAACLAISSLQGMDPGWIAQAPAAYRSMGHEKVQESMRRWCLPERRFSLVARPAPAKR
jgi:hypothetical protein